MKKTIFITTIGISIFSNFHISKTRDYVPNEATAIKIAEAVWLPIYGNKIYENKPFIAKLNSDSSIWYVRGSLPISKVTIDRDGYETIKMSVGGVPEIYINKVDGKILKVFHGK
jgi:NTF2 fold immunity protein